MNGEVKGFIKEVAKGVNAYTGLQFLWIIELYYLGINVFIGYKDCISSMLKTFLGCEITFPIPEQIQYYNSALLKILSLYSKTFAALGIVLIVLGLSFRFFSYSFLEDYKNVRHTSYGLYAGEWFLIIYGTYIVFHNFLIIYIFFAPIVSFFHWIRSHWSSWIEDCIEKLFER
jgi:hypothetical protein